MAKQGLNISADPTIVAAAGAYARAQNPFDMSKFNESLVKSQAGVLKSITGAATDYINTIKSYSEPIKTRMAEVEKAINDGTFSDPTAREEMQTYLDDLREELRNVPAGKKGQKQRGDLLYKLNKYMIAHEDDMENGLAFIQTVQDEKLWNPVATEDSHPGFNEAALAVGDYLKDPSKKVDNLTVTRDENNVTVFEYTKKDGSTIKGNLSDFNNMLVRVDNAGLKDFEGITGAVYQSVIGNEKKTEEQIRTDLYDGYMSVLSTHPNLYTTLAHQTVKGYGEESFYSALGNPESSIGKQLMEALSKINPDIDGNPETTDDYLTTGNYNKLVEQLKNPDAKFKETANQILTQFYIETEGMYNFKEAESHRPDEEEVVEKSETSVSQQENPYMGQISYITPSGETATRSVRLNNLAANANSFKEAEQYGGSFPGIDGNNYLYENGQWYTQVRSRMSITQDGVTERRGTLGEKKKITRDEVLSNLFLIDNLKLFNINPTNNRNTSGATSFNPVSPQSNNRIRIAGNNLV